MCWSTTSVQFRRKVAQILDRLPELELVLIVGVDEASVPDHADTGPTVMSFGRFVGEGHDVFERVADAARHSVAGALHERHDRGAERGRARPRSGGGARSRRRGSVLDLRAGDVYWCTADPGWVTGTSYGIIAPLLHGATVIVDEAEFDAARWYRILGDHRVDVFYTAPTAIRMLARVGDDAAPDGFPTLRLVASVGEPLDAESVLWAQRVFRVPVLDTWWQTETGAIMIANRLADPVRPGSMGHPVPGITVTLLERDRDGRTGHRHGGGGARGDRAGNHR